MDDWVDYGSDDFSNNDIEDIKLTALEHLTTMLRRYSDQWLFTNQESELSDYLKTTIKDNGIQNLEDFEDEEVISLKFCTLYTQNNNSVLQLPIHFLEPVIDTSCPCEISM